MKNLVNLTRFMEAGERKAATAKLPVNSTLIVRTLNDPANMAVLCVWCEQFTARGGVG